jgi:hypothetical protein
MIRTVVYAIVLTILMSPFLNAEAHRHVRETDAQVEHLAESKESPADRQKSFDLWHATFHCVSHLVANIDRQAPAEHYEWTIASAFLPAQNDAGVGLNLPPPVPPPLA